MKNSNTPIADSNRENVKISTSYSQISHLIGVTSGKGGVGKSLMTGILAVALARKGFLVGILDADFSSSIIPILFGIKGPVSVGHDSFLPALSHLGIKIISPNLLFAQNNQQVIWKEPL